MIYMNNAATARNTRNLLDQIRGNLNLLDEAIASAIDNDDDIDTRAMLVAAIKDAAALIEFAN